MNLILEDIWNEIHDSFKRLEKLEKECRVEELTVFYYERKKDYKEFIELTKNYNSSTPAGVVSGRLRALGASSHLYGGICSKGGKYFELSDYLEELLIHLFNSDSKCERIINYEYDIPDELSSEEVKIFSEQYLAQEPRWRLRAELLRKQMEENSMKKEKNVVN